MLRTTKITNKNCWFVNSVLLLTLIKNFLRVLSSMQFHLKKLFFVAMLGRKSNVWFESKKGLQQNPNHFLTKTFHMMSAPACPSQLRLKNIVQRLANISYHESFCWNIAIFLTGEINFSMVFSFCSQTVCTNRILLVSRTNKMWWKRNYSNIGNNRLIYFD